MDDPIDNLEQERLALEAAFRADFQKRLSSARTERGLTQRDMAVRLLMKESAYAKYENRANSTFPLYLLPRLSAITEKPYSYWLHGIEAEPPMTRKKPSHLRAVK